MENELPHENVPGSSSYESGGSSSDESGQEEKFYEAKQTQWIDEGYVTPRQEVHCEGLAILDGENLTTALKIWMLIWQSSIFNTNYPQTT